MLQTAVVQSHVMCIFVFVPNQEGVRSVHLVGDFNNWCKTSHPMSHIGSRWELSVSLEKGRKYSYRFLVNGEEWELDRLAVGGQVLHPYGGENSLIEVT